MTAFTTYGTSMHTVNELAQLITGSLGTVFTEHDSYFRGIYLVAETSTHTIEIQPNSIPGDNGEDELYEEKYPAIPTLLLVTAEALDTSINTGLNSIDGLQKLTEEAL